MSQEIEALETRIVAHRALLSAILVNYVNSTQEFN